MSFELLGTNGPDTLSNTSFEIVIRGLDGDDIITAASTGPSPTGFSVSYGWGFGLNYYGDDGDDTIFGGNGLEAIYGGNGDDTVYGNNGYDYIYADAGTDFYDGGDDPDLLIFEPDSRTETVRVDLKLDTIVNDGYGNTETVLNVEAVRGDSSVSNVIRGDAGANEILGGDMTDRLYGRAGDDFLFASNGGDLFNGGHGVDTLLFEYVPSRTYIIGSTGNSEGLLNGVNVDLSTNTILDDGYGNQGIVKRVENVGGTNFADTLTGNSLDNIFYASSGGDIIDGGGGIDTLAVVPEWSSGYQGVHVNLASGLIVDDGAGQSGTVTNVENLTGSAGDDILKGDAGDNVIIGQDYVVRYVSDIYTLEGPQGDILFGRAGDDILIASLGDRGFSEGEDKMYGGRGADYLEGNHGDDLLNGGRGDDKIFGNLDNDLLLGGRGRDKLFGGSGVDRLDGGKGNDRMSGGLGVDTFVFAGTGKDRIVDFQDNVDVVELDAVELGIAMGTSGLDIVTTFGTTVSGHAALDFGNGDVLIFVGLNAITDVADDLLLI